MIERNKINFVYKILILPFVFISIFYIHSTSLILTPYDSGWTIPLSISIVTEGNTNLDEYSSYINPNDYRIEQIGTHIYSYFPLGTPVLALPFVWLIEQIAPHRFDGGDLYHYVQNQPNGIHVAEVEKYIASCFVALTAVMLYAIAKIYVNSWRALIIVFIFGFCTSTLSTASRALWQHTTTILIISIVLYLFLQAETKPQLAQYIALPLVMLYTMRPTNSLSILLFTFWVLVRFRVWFIRYCFLALLVAIPFLFYNFSIYNQLLSSYYQPNRIVSSPFFSQALLGNLISPGRGLFVWTPILLFSLYGIYLWRTKGLTSIIVSVIVLHWLTISSYPHWYGGWSIGPRLFTDMIPYFVYFLIPVVQEFPKFSTVGQGLKTLFFLLIIALSFTIHYRSANQEAVVAWNSQPIDVDVNPSRIWDWNDIQFLRQPPKHLAKTS